MPDARPLWALEEMVQKIEVLPLGVEFADIGPPSPRRDGSPPLILWNHRWEYDKAPEEFFSVLVALAQKGAAFRVAVAGEAFSKVPPVFDEGRKLLGDRVVHWGYEPDRLAYVRLLAASDFVVSTAVQENFGLSVVEAAYAGAQPLAPRRLSYPEVLPASLHDSCLYAGVDDLERRLGGLLVGETERVPAKTLRAAMEAHAWENRVGVFDELMRQVFRGKNSGSVV
jgi:glycosyltransferase involved in cell wall biosynthesis